MRLRSVVIGLGLIGIAAALATVGLLVPGPPATREPEPKSDGPWAVCSVPKLISR